MWQTLALAFVLIASGALCVIFIAREMMRREPWEDIPCNCPRLLLHTQDRTGWHIKTFHSHYCPARKPAPEELE